MRRFVIGLALFASTATMSCAFLLDTDELKKGTGEEVDAGVTPAPIPLEDLPAALATATCSMVERCSGAAYDIYYPEEDCATVTEAGFEDSLFGVIELSIKEKRAEYVPEKAHACIDAFETLPCDEAALFPAACDEAMKGLVPLGGECGHTIDCPREAFCDVTSNTCPGTCKTRLDAGEACEFDDMCNDGLECFAKVCTRTPVLGEPCGATLPSCQLGYLCLTSETGGKCLAVDDLFRSLEGQSCNYKIGPLCEKGLHCAIKLDGTSTCEKGALTGGECKLALPDECPKGEYCQPDGVSLAGNCTAMPGANQPCLTGDDVLKPPCAAYHRCIPDGDDDVCVPVRRVDEPCDSYLQCYSGYCEPESNTCMTAGCVF